LRSSASGWGSGRYWEQADKSSKANPAGEWCLKHEKKEASFVGTFFIVAVLGDKTCANEQKVGQIAEINSSFTGLSAALPPCACFTRCFIGQDLQDLQDCRRRCRLALVLRDVLLDRIYRIYRMVGGVAALVLFYGMFFGQNEQDLQDGRRRCRLGLVLRDVFLDRMNRIYRIVGGVAALNLFYEMFFGQDKQDLRDGRRRCRLGQ